MVIISCDLSTPAPVIEFRIECQDLIQRARAGAASSTEVDALSVLVLSDGRIFASAKDVVVELRIPQ